MDLKQAVELFDEFFGDNDTALRFSKAWQTLKAHCTQSTAHNIPSMPCSSLDCPRNIKGACGVNLNCAQYKP